MGDRESDEGALSAPTPTESPGTHRLATSACGRCGHDRHQPPALGERVRRGFGMKATRMRCDEPTELGACPCRSRFHVR